MPSLRDRFEASILCGAIGDAWGSSYENEIKKDYSRTFIYGNLPELKRIWSITDDTQMTLLTCEALCNPANFSAELLAKHFIQYHRKTPFSGIGASTLKALNDLQSGVHWGLAGRSGDYAAGNGAAMRIAPLAFFKDLSKEQLRDVCRITHKNDEAYTGALAVFLCIRAIMDQTWTGKENLFELIIPQLPDTNLRDRMIQINGLPGTSGIRDVARLGTNGYVVNSIPFSIFAASKVLEIGLEQMMHDIIDGGGDTDTNASVAGQIAGALLGMAKVPETLLLKLQELRQYNWINQTIRTTKELL